MVRKLSGILLALLMACGFVCGESFEFVNRDIGEILYAVSMFRNFPVYCDDTVEGKADFRCAGDNFDEDFNSFLTQNRLYVEKTDSSWIVSRMRIQNRVENNRTVYSLDACDVSPSVLFEKVSIALGITITGEALPNVKVSIHTGFCEKENLINSLVRLCPGSEVEMADGSIHIRRKNSGEQNAAASGRAVFVAGSDDEIDCDVQNAQLWYAAEKLFDAGNKKFSVVSGGEGKISRAKFSGLGFDETLEIICAQAGCEFAKDGEVYLIYGSKKAREKIQDSSKKWQKLELKNISSGQFAALFSRRFGDVQFVNVNDRPYFVYAADSREDKEIREFAEICDVSVDARLVQLKYIRTKDLLADLPPFVEKSCITDSGKGDSFYYTGSEEGYQRLVEGLKEFDKSSSSITYDLLIMQYQKSENDEWASGFSGDKVALGDRNGIAAQLGSVLNLNLDVVSAFGLKFAAELQAAISETKAHVFADTTLNGVSGSTISFANTNTYRYRDNNLDPDTGKPVYSGVTREIISGLKLEVTGIVTGDGMITSNITASVSRQGADTSSKTGNPPPSSEKLITTQVRSRSGEPVILSGLVQTEESQTETKTPWLSGIPLIGRLFESDVTTKEQTELVIYLVPKVSGLCSDESEEVVMKGRIEKAYREFGHDEA